MSSYGAGTTSSGQVKITKDLSEEYWGRDIIVVEDILDSGNTLSYTASDPPGPAPASMKLCTLLDKPDRRIKPSMWTTALFHPRTSSWWGMAWTLPKNTATALHRRAQALRL